MNSSKQFQRRGGVVEMEKAVRLAHPNSPIQREVSVVTPQPLQVKKVKKNSWNLGFAPGGLRVRGGGARYMGMGPSMYYLKVKKTSPCYDPDVPKTVAIGPRSRILIVSEMDAYLEKKAAQRDSSATCANESDPVACKYSGAEDEVEVKPDTASRKGVSRAGMSPRKYGKEAAHG